MARKKTSGRRPPTGEPADPRGRVIAAALRLAAKRRWRGVALADIADEARLSLSDLYALFPSKFAILDAFVGDIDRRVMSAVAAEPGEGSARDRLFDVLMRRFDALGPHRAAVASILKSAACDPAALVCGALSFRRSMAAMLEAAGISADGVAGKLRVKGVGAIYLEALCTWLADDAADKAKTMAALDRRLRQAESCLNALRRRPAAAAA